VTQGERSASRYGARCFARAGLGDREAAEVACRKALAIEPGNLFDRGMLAFLEGRGADARRDGQKVSADERVLKSWLAKLTARQGASTKTGKRIPCLRSAGSSGGSA